MERAIALSDDHNITVDDLNLKTTQEKIVASTPAPETLIIDAMDLGTGAPEHNAGTRTNSLA
jgi:hypothetical protein